MQLLLTKLGINARVDVRAIVHNWAPIVGAALLGTSLFVGDSASIVTAVVGLLVAITSPTLASLNTVDRARRRLYLAVPFVGTILVTIGLVTNDRWAVAAALIPIMLGTGTAAANTPTTSAFTQGQLGIADPTSPVVD